MSVRHALMALLAEGPRYGYQLRQAFEARTGGSWPLNIGQVYTTLGRLQRDGLVTEVERHDDGTVVYGLTDAGHEETAAWWRTPVPRSAVERDELAIKVAVAITSPDVDAAAVIQRQRTESVRALQRHTRDAAGLGDAADPAAFAQSLVLDRAAFAVEAELRWLDHLEQRLARRPGTPTTTHQGETR